MPTSSSRTSDGTSPSRPRFWLLGLILLLAATVAAAQTPQTYELLHAFRNSGRPMGALIQSDDGYFYGTTYYGGTNGVGTVFRIDLAGRLTTIHSFAYADGAHPTSGLLRGMDGLFYGTTTLGGTSNHGVIFRIDALGSVTVLHSFDGSDGSGPRAPLIQ